MTANESKQAGVLSATEAHRDTDAHADKSDKWVAGRVRMLMRDDIEFEPILVAARDRIMRLSTQLAAAIAERNSLRQETQVTREALNDLTTATAMLDLGTEDGDERAVVRNVIVGVRALVRERDTAREALREAQQPPPHRERPSDDAWVLPYDFIGKLHDEIKDHAWRPSMEGIELVLLAYERLTNRALLTDARPSPASAETESSNGS